MRGTTTNNNLLAAYTPTSLHNINAHPPLSTITPLISPTAFAVWGVDAMCPHGHLPLVAYVGEDGTASLLVAGEEWESRRRDTRCLGGIYKLRPEGSTELDALLKEPEEGKDKKTNKARKKRQDSGDEDEEGLGDDDSDGEDGRQGDKEPESYPMALDDDSLGLLLYSDAPPKNTHVPHRVYAEDMALHRIKLKQLGDDEVVAVYGGAAGIVRCQGVS